MRIIPIKPPRVGTSFNNRKEVRTKKTGVKESIGMAKERSIFCRAFRYSNMAKKFKEAVHSTAV